MTVVPFPQTARCATCGGKEVVTVVCRVTDGTENTQHFCRDHEPRQDAFDFFALYCVAEYEWLPAEDKASILFDIKAALAATGCCVSRSPQGTAHE